MIRPSAALLVSALITLGSGRAEASTPSCAPVRLLGDAASLPDAYRAAIADLVEATSHAGKPWSCSGGTIALVLSPNERTATLSLVDASGHTATRTVEGPDDLRAVVEALLANPLVAEASPPPPSVETESPPVRTAAPPPPAQNIAPSPPARTEPRLLIEALFGARGSSPFPTVWGAGELRGSVPIDAFRIGVWARLALPMHYEDRPPRRHFNMQEVDFGISVGRVLVNGPFEMSARFDPCFAVVTAEAGRESDPDHDQDEEGARASFRLGLGLVGKLHLTRLLRAVVVLDGNLAPLAIGSNSPIAADLPLPPVYTFGLSLGAEAIIP